MLALGPRPGGRVSPLAVRVIAQSQEVKAKALGLARLEVVDEFIEAQLSASPQPQTAKPQVSSSA